MVNRWKSARTKGYNLENDCVKFYRQLGGFALRIGARTKEYQRRAIDVIAFYQNKFYIIQCKRHKKYMTKQEIQNLILAATQFGAVALLCYRKKGLVFETIWKKDTT